jgi:hypothetical protein
MTDLYEPIRVWVLFETNKIEPFIFFWRERKITIESINMVHTSKSEGGLLYHFSVSSGGNYYRLQFNIAKMKWFLEQIEQSD